MYLQALSNRDEEEAERVWASVPFRDMRQFNSAIDEAKGSRE